MKKKLLLLFLIMAVIAVLSFAIVRISGKSDKNVTADSKIVTSFYPMYVLTENIIDGAEGIEITNMTENQTGCLHDYQLTTKDMVTISNADVFVMSGNGMESFLEEVVAEFPKLKVVVAGEDIELLESTHEHHHEEDHEGEHEEDHEGDLEEHEEHEDHDHADHEQNGHVWMDIDRYIAEVKHACDELCEIYPDYAELFKSNTENYTGELENLKNEFEISNFNGENIIIFHEAFEYLAASLGMNTVHAVEMDSETTLSAGELAEIVEEIKENNVRFIFTEAQFSTAIPDAVAEETGVSVIVIDSLVTGDGDKNSYLDGMRKNYKVLKECAAQD